MAIVWLSCDDSLGFLCLMLRLKCFRRKKSSLLTRLASLWRTDDQPSIKSCYLPYSSKF